MFDKTCTDIFEHTPKIFRKFGLLCYIQLQNHTGYSLALASFLEALRPYFSWKAKHRNTSVVVAFLFAPLRVRMINRAEKSVEIGKDLPEKLDMLAGNYSVASQIKSNNMQRIASKSQD